MFFQLSNTKTSNFPCFYTLSNGLILNCDDGWKEYKLKDHHVVFKGYANKYPADKLAELLVDTTYPTMKGNFCAFVSDATNTTIMHDTNRSFPLWANDEKITNLQPLERQIWADCLLTVDASFKITKNYFSPYTKDILYFEDEKILNNIHETILETYEQFLTHNTKPLKIFLSGGLDTITSWAYLDYFTKNYEIVDYEYIKYTDFYKKNSGLVRQHWGYNQIHLWDHDCVLVSGGNGDENFLRGPMTLDMMLRHHGTKIADIIKKEDYHYWYLSKKNINDDVDKWYAKTDDVKNWVLNRNINDHQHWHIDNTITFTPFKDISILASILNISKQLLIQQAKQGEINRQLIARLDVNKLSKISRQKNLNHMENV